jgi:hypothetical protein
MFAIGFAVGRASFNSASERERAKLELEAWNDEPRRRETGAP